MTDITNKCDFKIHKRILSLMMAFLVLAACQGQGVYRGYSGKAMPADKVAGLLVPKQFDLLYIDGNKYAASVLSDGARLELLPGKHRLVIEYDELWDITVDDFDHITSQPVLLSFTVKPGRRYALQSRQLKDINDARAYARKPKVEMIDQVSRQSVPVVLKYRLGDKKYMASFTADTPAMDDREKADKAPGMLEYWWRQSDYEQQQRFLDWAKSHRKTREE